MNTATTTTQPIVITEYEKLQNDISIAVKESEGVTFNYRDPKENRAARSHIHTLRKLKGAIESARKEAKSYALEYGRKVDAMAKDMSNQVIALIDPHEKEIKLIEQEEADRVAKHQAVIDHIIKCRSAECRERLTSHGLGQLIDKLDAISTDSLEEFKPQADAELIETMKALRDARQKVLEQEARDRELALLREEQERREQEERDRKLKEEAEQRARAEAEEMAQRERDEQERRHRDEIAAREKAELESRLAAERAEREKQEAVQRAQRLEQEAEDRRKAEQQAADDAEAARIAAEDAKKKRRSVAIDLITEELAKLKSDKDKATAIVDGKIHAIDVDWSKF